MRAREAVAAVAAAAAQKVASGSICCPRHVSALWLQTFQIDLSHMASVHSHCSSGVGGGTKVCMATDVMPTARVHPTVPEKHDKMFETASVHSGGATGSGGGAEGCQLKKLYTTYDTSSKIEVILLLRNNETSDYTHWRQHGSWRRHELDGIVFAACIGRDDKLGR